MNVFDNITATKHAVAESSLLKATVAGHIYNIRVQEGTSLDNGNIISRGAWEATTPDGQVFAAAAYVDGAPLLVLTPPFAYDSRRAANEECYFYNAAGEIARAYELYVGDIFAVSAEAFTGAPAVNKHVSVDANKLKVADAAVSGKFDGLIIDQAANGNYLVLVQHL